MGERQQAVAALRASEERFRAITESANDAIISADSSGHIVSWNARAEAIFGYTAEEILGAPFTRLMPTRYHAAHMSALRNGLLPALLAWLAQRWNLPASAKMAVSSRWRFRSRPGRRRTATT